MQSVEHYLRNLVAGEGSGSDDRRRALVKNTFLSIEEGTGADSPVRRTMSDPGGLSDRIATMLRRSRSTGPEGGGSDEDCESDEDFGITEPSSSEGSSRREGRGAVSGAAGSSSSSTTRFGNALIGPAGRGAASAAAGSCSGAKTLGNALGDDGVFLAPSWSKGAEGHEEGTCKPCAWFFKPGGCSKGPACKFCHMCGPDELKKRRKERYADLKAKTGWKKKKDWRRER
mmetsp:Transcript_129227/g.359868  ORF Transcript_129227/g.359868 Transcript_129227/m.359868 type:complete len:229 (+) Transcript_129227:121-807(+)